MTPTAVYLIRNIWAESNYKIGISSVVQRRAWQVEEGYGVASMIVTSVWFPTRDAAIAAETKWHRFLKAYRTDDHGGKEWFCLPEHQLQQFLDWSKGSPDESILKLQVKAKRLSYSEARSITTKLIRAIPTNGRRTIICRTDSTGTAGYS